MNRTTLLQDRRMEKFEELLKRWHDGELSGAEAGEFLGCSERQFRRRPPLRVAEQEKLVAVWRETISALTKEGQPTDLAEKMLRLMEARLDAFRADLAKLGN